MGDVELILRNKARSDFVVHCSPLWFTFTSFLPYITSVFNSKRKILDRRYVTLSQGARDFSNLKKGRGPQESIRGEKKVQENLTLAYDSVETENKNREVLECQLVTTSWSQDSWTGSCATGPGVLPVCVLLASVFPGERGVEHDSARCAVRHQCRQVDRLFHRGRVNGCGGTIMWTIWPCRVLC